SLTRLDTLLADDFFAHGAGGSLPKVRRLSSLQHARNRHQYHGTDKRDDDRADHSARRPYPQFPEKPAAQKSAQNPENHVHDDSVVAAFHDQAREPTRDESYKQPCQNSHVDPP